MQQNPEEPFARITVDEAKEMIDKGGVQTVDVRQPNEYKEGHIAGTALITLDALMKRSGELSEDDPIIFICGVGERSAVACEIAAAVGREKIYNMQGGMDAWAKKGYPVEK